MAINLNVPFINLLVFIRYQFELVTNSLGISLELIRPLVIVNGYHFSGVQIKSALN